MVYRGSCHCGQIAFEVEGRIEAALACSCSICARKGALLWVVPHERLRLAAWEDGIGRYTFNAHRIVHRFCRICGIHPFAEDAGDGPGRNAYVNLRCVDALDLDALRIVEFDRRSA
jgi:hypothetical protein